MKAWIIAIGAVLTFVGLGGAILLWIASRMKGQEEPLIDEEITAALLGEFIGCAVGVVGIGLIVWASNYL
jgi:hypothetical protein